MILFLFFMGSAYGWTVLRGNLSASKFLNAVPLTDPFAMVQVLATGNLVSAEALIGAALAALFFILIAGRSFCAWVCPMNIVTDAAAWLRRKLGLSAQREVRISTNVRYWALGIVIVVSAITGVAAFEWVSPISMLTRGILFGMGAGWVLIGAVFLFDALVVQNGFCGRICPLGAFYSLISGFRFLKIRHYREQCTECGECLARCPEKHVLANVGKQSGPVHSGECTLCGRCIDVCRYNAMSLR